MKKGFTLVELLAVIVILGVLAVITTVSVTKILSGSKDSLSDIQKKNIEDAAKAYYLKEGMNEDAACVSVSDLISKGYIESKEVIDPKTKEPFKGGVKITNVNNQYIYTYENIPGFCQPLTKFIEALYTPNSTALNNGITYNIDTTNGIIDDGLGGTVASGGNLRYYGANPDNYIDIGDRDENGDPILWRIIGLFETKYATESQPCNIDSDSDGHFDNCASDKLVKIIRNDSIGGYTWDMKATGTWSNNWSDSTLKTMLNEAYYNSTTTIYYNNNTTPKTVDFTNTGLSLNARIKIENALWNLGGHSVRQIYSNEIYGYERGINVYSGNPTEWVGKIGLMYPSDYGYATDLTKCSENLNDYDSDNDSYACKINDWLQKAQYQWTLTDYVELNGVVYVVSPTGDVSSYGTIYGHTCIVRPVVHLKSDLRITGEGTTSDGIKYKIVE